MILSCLSQMERFSGGWRSRPGRRRRRRPQAAPFEGRACRAVSFSRLHFTARCDQLPQLQCLNDLTRFFPVFHRHSLEAQEPQLPAAEVAEPQLPAPEVDKPLPAALP